MPTESEQATIRSLVRDRVDGITRRPQMHAHSREAYAAQLAVLLELAGWHGGKLYDLFEREGAIVLGLDELLDDEWSKKIGNQARIMAGLPLL